MTEILLLCSRCSGEFQAPAEGWSCDCPHCGKSLDLHGQFAYLRGSRAFEDAMQTMSRLKQIKKEKKGTDYLLAYHAHEEEGYSLFSEAYTALIEALQYELPARHYEHGIEMIVHTAQLFQRRNMISTLEAGYWRALMVVQTARNEQVAIQQKIARSQGILEFLLRWRRKARLAQLEQELSRLEQRIRLMESNLSFAHPIRIYRSGRV